MAEPSATPRRRSPALVAWLLALSLGLIVVLAGPLLLFNPWFVSFEQARNGIPARLGTTQVRVDAVTAGILRDLFMSGSFDEGLDSGPLLTENERSHMRDVGGLVRALLAVLTAALVVIIAAAILLRREPRRIGRVMLLAGAVTGGLAVVLAALFAVAFDQAFLAFHELFFPQGNFLFGPDSNLLRLFPEGFWFEASLAAGLAIIGSAIVLSLVGLRLSRS
jgi:Protein of unknown function (DUF1461)